MAALLLVLLILVVVVMAGRQWYLWARRDARSIKAHRSTLGHLEHLSSEVEPTVPHRDPAPHVKIVGRVAKPPVPVEPVQVERAPVERAPVERVPAEPTPVKPVRKPLRPPPPPPPPPSRQPVFVDESGPKPPPGRGWSDPVPARPGTRVRPRRRARTRVPLMEAAAAVLIVLAGGLTVLLHGGSGSGAHRIAGRPVASPTTTSPVTRPAPTTTVPLPIVTVVSTGAGEASYTASSHTVLLNLAVTRAPCWIELRSSSVNGPTVFQGILQPGAVHRFQAVGGLWLRLGNPAGVAVQLDGQPVNLPKAPSPYNVSVTSSA